MKGPVTESVILAFSAERVQWWWGLDRKFQFSGHLDGPLLGAKRRCGLAHVVGRAGHVSIPEWALAAAKQAFTSDFKAEVLWIHNHPENDLNRLLDNTPIASVQDRKVLVTTKFDQTAITKLVGGGGRMKFYLVEKGFVREFTTPPVMQVVQQVLQRFA